MPWLCVFHRGTYFGRRVAFGINLRKNPVCGKRKRLTYFRKKNSPESFCRQERCSCQINHSRKLSELVLSNLGTSKTKVE